MTNRLQDDVARSAMAGVSTGGRTFTALAAQALTARPDATGQPDSALAKPWVKGVLGLLALTELVMDKLPSTPSRLEPAGLPGRLIAGATCGAIIARRDLDPDGAEWTADPTAERTTDPGAFPADSVETRNRTIACVLAGVASAAGASWCGVQFRSAAASGLGRDWIGAGVEDAAALGLAAAAARAR